MGYTLTHEIWSEEFNLIKTLIEKGIIHPALLYGPNSHRYFNFEHVFDYRKCGDQESIDSLLKEKQEDDEKFLKNLENIKYESVRQERIKEHERYDHFLLPVYTYRDEGSVNWSLNYFEDCRPAYAISRIFPDKELHFRLLGEYNALYANEILKNGKVIKQLETHSGIYDESEEDENE